MTVEAKKYKIFNPKDYIVQKTPIERQAGAITSPTEGDIPLPEFPPDALYANSKEFQNILWRAKQFGLDKLTQGELNQIKSGAENYPQVADFLGGLERKGEQSKQEEAGILQSGKDWIESIKPDLSTLPTALANMTGLGDNAFTDWVQSKTKFKHTLGEPEFIPEIAEAAAKGLLKFPPAMANQLLQEWDNNGPIVGSVRFAAGLMKFPFQVGTDLFNMFGTGIPASTEIGDVPIEEIQAPTAQQVIEQYKQDPTPIILVALPFLKAGKTYLDKNTPDGGGGLAARKAQIERSINILEEKYRRQIEAEQQAAVADAKASQQFKPEIEATAEPQISRIKALPPGELLSEAFTLQGEGGYSAPELMKLYGLDREYVENIVSGDRMGKKPLSKEEISKAAPERGVDESYVKIAEQELDRVTGILQKAQDEYGQARTEFEAFKPRDVRLQSEQYEAAKTNMEKARMGVATAQELFNESKSALDKAKAGEAKPIKKVKRAKKETVAEEVSAQAGLEPVSAKEVRIKEKEVATLQADIRGKETAIDDLEGATGPSAKAAKEFQLQLKVQVAERQVKLTEAAKELAELKKRPILKEEEKPPEMPPESPKTELPPQKTTGEAEKVAQAKPEAIPTPEEIAPGGIISEQKKPPVPDRLVQPILKPEGKDNYFHGDKIQYTGVTQELYGRMAYEFEFQEGIHKGEKIWQYKSLEEMSNEPKVIKEPLGAPSAKIKHKLDLKDIEARDLYGLLSDVKDIPQIVAFTDKLAKHENKQLISDNASGRAFHGTIDEATRKAIVDYLKADQEIVRKNSPDNLVHPKWQRFIDKFEAMAKEIAPEEIIQKKDISEASEIFKGKVSEPFILDAKDVNVDVERFQPRENEFAKTTAEGIAEGADPAKLQAHPIVVWKDPKNGKYYILEGHSRNQGLSKIKVPDRKVTEFYGTEKEAMAFAEESNLAAAHTYAEDVPIFRRQRDKENWPQKRLKGQWGDRYNKLEAYTHLDPRGKFMEIISQEAKSSFPYVEQKARDVGEIRKDFPELTNTHEKQIFDAFYPTDAVSTRYLNMPKDNFRQLIESQVTDAQWNKDRPLKFGGSATIEGLAARADTGPTVMRINALKKKIKELKEEKGKKGATQLIAEHQAEIDELYAKLEKYADEQYSMELGAFGTPQIYKELFGNIGAGLESIRKWGIEAIESAKLPPEVKEGRIEAINSMIDHHRMQLDAKVQRIAAADQFKRAVPDESRWVTILKAWEMGPKSKYWGQLNGFERNITNWLREESQRWEQFALDNGLLDKPKNRPAGYVHVFHHWINPKTGKPFRPEFGRFASTSPVLQKAIYESFEAGEAAGLKIATKNPGALLGHTIVNLMKTHATRELYKNLHNVEYTKSFQINDAGVARNMMMIEPWRLLEDEGLMEGYVRLDDSFLDIPIRFKTRTGLFKEIKGPIGMREEIYPWWKAYRESPDMSKFEKFLQASKSTVLMGFFHPAQLAMQQIATKRFPFTGIKKGLDRLKHPDEITQGLMRNGLESSWTEYGLDPKSLFSIDEGKFIKGPIAKGINFLLTPQKYSSMLIFDIIHPGMKTTFAYDTFNKVWPKYAKDGLLKEQAYRDVVKMADQLFSGKDYRYAMLGANKFMVDYWYSASARRFWRNALLSPTWQESHISAFLNVVKSVTPDAILKNPKAPIANRYRWYLAGALTLYTAANMYNWVATKQMDGEGKFMFQNEPGKRLRVRALWDNPDGSAAYMMPFKSIFEVPEMINAAINGDFGKFTNKISPLYDETVKLAFNLDEFGRSRTDEASLVDRLKDFAAGQWAPIAISQVFSTMKAHKAPIGIVFSNLGFPVSKGYAGGAEGMMIDDLKRSKRTEREEIFKEVDDLIISSMDGNSGDLLNAMYIMVEQLGMDDNAINLRLMKFENPLLHKWWTLSDIDKNTIFTTLNEENRQKFLDKLLGG